MVVSDNKKDKIVSILDSLREGHQLTLEKLLRLEIIAQDIAQGSSLSASGLKDLGDILVYFDKEVEAHFELEEVALFPAMEKFMGQAGFIGAMLEEHQSFWRAVDALKEITEGMKSSGKMESKKILELREIILHIVAYLRSHIDKEEKSFFPLVEKTLSPGVLKEISL